MTVCAELRWQARAASQATCQTNNTCSSARLHLLACLPCTQVLDDANIRDPFVRNWLDLLSFLLSGLPADGTIAAEVAFMFNQW